jgi:PAS domain-containing protein
MNDRENAQKESIEEELRLSESRYHQIFNDNPLSSLIYDSETLQIIDINIIAMEHYQYSREEFLALTIKELYPPEDIPSLIECLAKADPSRRRAPPR